MVLAPGGVVKRTLYIAGVAVLTTTDGNAAADELVYLLKDHLGSSLLVRGDSRSESRPPRTG